MWSHHYQRRILEIWPKGNVIFNRDMYNFWHFYKLQTFFTSWKCHHSQRQSKVPAEEEQLSWSLAQRLSPPVQRNPQWIPPWKRSAAQQGPSRADLQVNNSSLQSARPPCGGKGRGRGRGRGRNKRGNNGSKRQSQTPDPGPQTSEPLRDGMFTAETDNPQPSKVMKKSSQLHKDSESEQKRRKGLEGGDHSESVMFQKMVTLEADVDKKGRIQAWWCCQSFNRLYCFVFCE